MSMTFLRYSLSITRAELFDSNTSICICSFARAKLILLLLFFRLLISNYFYIIFFYSVAWPWNVKRHRYPVILLFGYCHLSEFIFLVILSGIHRLCDWKACRWNGLSNKNNSWTAFDENRFILYLHAQGELNTHKYTCTHNYLRTHAHRHTHIHYVDYSICQTKWKASNTFSHTHTRVNW